jgi:hypothetical protein
VGSLEDAYEDHEGDVSAAMKEDEDGEVHSDGEDGEDGAVAGTRSWPQSQRVVDGYISSSSPPASGSPASQ